MASKFLVITVIVLSAIVLGSMAFVIASREALNDFETEVSKPTEGVDIWN